MGKRADIFTHIIYDYDVEPLSLQVLDSEKSEEKENVYYFRDFIIEMSISYKTKHLLLLVGSGLNFEKAELYLQQIQSLIDHFNSQHSDIKLLFSSLSQYDEALSSHKTEFPITYNDSQLIQYTQDGIYYSTGLYTSRPNLKSYIRRASQVMQASSKIIIAHLLEMQGSTPYRPEYFVEA